MAKVCLVRLLIEERTRTERQIFTMIDKNDLQAWDRPYLSAAGGDAELLYAVFGDFPQALHPSLSEYRTAGLPSGVELTAYPRDIHAEFVASFHQDWQGQSLRSDDPVLFNAVERAPTCLLLRGRVADPATLLYLRDTVGVLTALLESGGVAVLDVQALTWFSPRQWRERMFEPNAPVPTHHVSLLLSPESQEGHVWVHTRGMRKFGRPDLSIHSVVPDYQDGCIDLCNRFITMMACGGQVPEGQAVRMGGLPEGMVCHHRGDYDDPDFNNVHLEVTQPA